MCEDPLSREAFIRKFAVHRKGPRAFQNQKHGHREGQQMKFEALALLASRPVHKEAEPAVNHGDCDKHVDRYPEGSNPRQATENQSQATEELSCYSEEGKNGRDMQGPCEEAHRA